MENVNQEVWRDVVGYEGVYLVSNQGRVKRVKDANNQYKGGHILKSNIHRGYHHVQLHRNGVAKNKRVHRLVASAFIPNKENKPHVNHKNGVRGDNRKSNLEWCTPSENELHKYRVLGYQSHSKKLTDADVVKIREMYNTYEYTMKDLGDMFGVTPSCIYHVVSLRKGSKGTGNGAAELNEQKVKEIRQRFKHQKNLTFKEIAKEYGVSYQTISRVVKRQTWEHI